MMQDAGQQEEADTLQVLSVDSSNDMLPDEVEDKASNDLW